MYKNKRTKEIIKECEKFCKKKLLIWKCMKLWNEKEKAQETEVKRKNGSQRKYKKEERGIKLRVKKMKDFIPGLLSKMKNIGGQEGK